MGLDATVYCDCLERGRLRVPPRPEWNVYVGEEGARYPGVKAHNQQIAFDSWDLRVACEHECGVLLHHHLGNIALIALFRKILQPHADRLPVLTTKVIYSGTHCGDFLATTQVEELAVEVEILSRVLCAEPRDEQFLRDFEQQLRSLIECSRRVHKPIAF